MSSKGYPPRCQQGDVKRTGRQWHSGPPPHIGWWNASAMQQVRAWRWWDGRCWSRVTQSDAAAVFAAACAQQPELPERQTCILWTEYWPEGARVPRQRPAASPPTEAEYLRMRSATHDSPACAIFRGGRCTCDAQDAPGGGGNDGR